MRTLTTESALGGELNEPWLSIAEVVGWVAVRGNPDAQYDSRHFLTPKSDGLGGDRDEPTLRLFAAARVTVREALAGGKLIAWAQKDREEPVAVPPARWSRAFRDAGAVSDYDLDINLGRVRVLRSDVLNLWPETGAPKGRPIEYDWDKIRELALSAVDSQPKVSRNALAESLVLEYQDVVGSHGPEVSTIKKKLREWGLPRAK